MIGKRKLFTETFRERIIEVTTTIFGIIGGYLGAILHGDIFKGVIIYTIKYSIVGGIIGIILALLTCNINHTDKPRNFLERFIGNIFSILGATLFGLTIGGFFGYFLNDPIFIKIYNRDIYDSIIAINSNLGDGILIGGIAGGISCTIGALMDTVSSFFLDDIVMRFFKQKKYKYVTSTLNKPTQKPATPQQPKPVATANPTPSA